ncbi:MAG: alcohol dehydrogenase catalytic domain-containing protein [Anaerolineales bacterium]|nr:alcohol dehydrogenase catalytic domain-containing protein [Anaerolineales bacterium]
MRGHSCGVCHADLHVVEGDLSLPEFPVVFGHQVAGVVDALGDGVAGWKIGDRVGVPWLSHTCGTC